METGKKVKKLKTRALLFDLDGTIVDPSRALTQAAEITLCEMGISGKDSASFGREMAQLLQLNSSLDELFEKMGINKRLRKKALCIFLQSFYEIAPTQTVAFPRVEKTLRALSKEYPLALITRRSVSKESIESELKRLRLRHYFATIVTSLEVENPTPSPDAIVKAAGKLLVPTHDCVVISDSAVDIEAGKSVGSKTVAVLSGFFRENELIESKPDIILENITQLSDRLLPL